MERRYVSNERGRGFDASDRNVRSIPFERSIEDWDASERFDESLFNESTDRIEFAMNEVNDPTKQESYGIHNR